MIDGTKSGHTGQSESYARNWIDLPVGPLVSNLRAKSGCSPKSVKNSSKHGLSHQGVWVPFWTPKPLKRTPQDTRSFLCWISKNLNLKLVIELFHLLMIPMTLINDIMPYFDEFIHTYGWNMSMLWSPLKIWTPKDFTTADFWHPDSKSWLRQCLKGIISLRRYPRGK